VLGATPTSIYLLAPLACVIAIVWQFRTNCQNLVIQSMFSAGFSVRMCAAPGILLGVVFTFLTIVIAWVVAPIGVTIVEDVKFDLRRNIDIGSLRSGRFHAINLEGNKVNLSFKKHLGGNRIQAVILSVSPAAGEKFVIVAKWALIKKDMKTFAIFLFDGNIHRQKDDEVVKAVGFKTYKLSFPMRGASSGYVRSSKTALELSFSELLRQATQPNIPKKPAGRARSELAKRLLLPPMNLAHALLALGILFIIGPMRASRERHHIWIPVGFLAVQGMVVVSIEILARESFAVYWVIGALMIAETIFGIALLARAGSTVRKFSPRSAVQIFSRHNKNHGRATRGTP
jgi:lipopolysaccharide export LptBFGC system permease protein LptF